MRKILIITNRVPFPMNDGGNLAMRAMIEGYNQNGWSVYLLAMNTSRHYVDPEVLTTLYQDIASFEWVDVNNDIKPIGVLSNYFFSKQAEHVGRFYHKHFEEKVIRTVTEFKPDVVQIESVYLTTYLPAVKANSNALTILRSHNVEYHIWHGLAMQTKNPIKKNYLLELTKRLKDFERKAWKAYDIVLAITAKDAYHMTRHEKIKHLIVAPFSIKMTNIPPPSGLERWVGYHIGAMDWIPNRNAIRWFIESAWPKIKATCPDFEFYFAGRKMPQEFKVNLPKGIFCNGEVESAEDFIADKKILIVPVKTAGGIRIKIMEGMASGKIVISTTDGIKGLEAKANEHYLSARSSEDFANAIDWCLRNKNEANQIAEKGRALMVSKYDQDVVIKKVIQEIDAVSSNRF